MLDVTLGSLYVDTQVYFPALLKNLRAMSCSGAYWLLGGGWFWCRYGGFWMVSYYLMFRVVRSFLVREACVSVLVRGTGFLLSGVQWSVP